jgi:hypothetical protein
MNPKRITLEAFVNPKFAHEVFATAEKRKAWAKKIALIVSMEDNGDDMPYNHQPGDDYRWAIDRYGNDYWLTFSRENNLRFDLSCRYESEVDILQALANYVCARLVCKIVE